MKFAIAAVLGVALGCSHHGDEHFRDMAATMNPVIQRLRAQAAIVLDPGKRADTQALGSACVAGVETAKPLAAFRFNDGYAGSTRQVGVDDVMFMFSHDAHNYCVDGHFDADCAEWCVKRYAELADAVDRLRAEGAKENVQIEPLLK